MNNKVFFTIVTIIVVIVIVITTIKKQSNSENWIYLSGTSEEARYIDMNSIQKYMCTYKDGSSYKTITANIKKDIYNNQTFQIINLSFNELGHEAINYWDFYDKNGNKYDEITMIVQECKLYNNKTSLWYRDFFVPLEDKGIFLNW